jgi:septal ring factor EnvC (AmiA/AmiB activator)
MRLSKMPVNEPDPTASPERKREAKLAREKALRKATTAYANFVDDYHRLALDADKSMWRHLRMLEDTLKKMLAKAEAGDAAACAELRERAAEHRRALEDSFRHRLGYTDIHDDPDPALDAKPYATARPADDA